jgi:hypothetical protein
MFPLIVLLCMPQVAPSLLLVKDCGGAVFGAYVVDAWRFSPRFYGSGETFVFQVIAAWTT